MSINRWWHGWLALFGCFVAAAIVAASDFATYAPPPKDPVPTLTMDEAITYALEHNPELAAFRKQRGIAAAGVVIARTYPFNPVWEGRVRYVTGPESAGITNVVSNEHNVLLEVELKGQGRIRREQALAALTRTDWEIAAQEMGLGARVWRGYQAILYRRDKLKLIEETIKLDEELDAEAPKLRDAKKITGADLILIRTEVYDARAQRGPGRAALLTAWQDFRRSLGLVDEIVDVKGTLGVAAAHGDPPALIAQALDQRPDLRAKQDAVREADAKWRLEIANRHGNPSMGTAYEYDIGRANMIGTMFMLPLPILNTRRGEILLRQAERERAGLELVQVETQVRQDVRSALERLDAAQATVKLYEKELLPQLREAQDKMKTALEEGGDTGADAVRLIDVRRKVLKARDSYLDALWELSQAEADLIAALGAPVWGTGEPPAP
jgi:outer membrane protein TolC